MNARNLPAICLSLAAAFAAAQTPFGLFDETNTLYSAAETRALVAAATNYTDAALGGYVATNHTGDIFVAGRFAQGFGGTESTGYFSHAEGNGVRSTGDFSHAEGIATLASGGAAHAEGIASAATNDFSWTWNGDENAYDAELRPYGSHGDGTFNVNPVGGMAGMYVGEQSMAEHLDSAITNYYALSSLGRVSIDTNGVLAVDVRDSATNEWRRAWDSADVASALDANSRTMAQVETTLGTAVAAWADFDAQGHPNPDPDLITLNRAYTAIGSGFFWASSGGYYCLCAEGTVAYLAEAEGSIRFFGNSISNYFGLVAGGTVTVGADASGFRVQNGLASITYPYTGGDHPTIYGAATLAGPWTEMPSVWVDDASAGTATSSFPADQTAFFFKATTTRQLSEYFHATVPSYLEGGVKTASDDLSPVVYDSKITIQSGGHTYRIPAQLVQ